MLYSVPFHLSANLPTLLTFIFSGLNNFVQTIFNKVLLHPFKLRSHRLACHWGLIELSIVDNSSSCVSVSNTDPMQPRAK